MSAAAPLSAVIATRNRASSLSRTLDSLLSQAVIPAELIVVDASDDAATRYVVTKFAEATGSSPVHWFPADTPGAASQRNQGISYALQPFVWFFDDDILFEPHCVQRLWGAIELDRKLGGVNAMIVNQCYQAPGTASKIMFTLMHGRGEKSFAGKIIGPAINLLPEDRDDLPEAVPVEWLNTTCTIYRREALPSPPFDSFFTNYSLMEDVALSVRVRQGGWKLANVRRARILHDSQSETHKSDASSYAMMELINRYYVMTNVLEKRSWLDCVRLASWELFSVASMAASATSRTNLRSVLAGKWRALNELRGHKSPKASSKCG